MVGVLILLDSRYIEPDDLGSIDNYDVVAEINDYARRHNLTDMLHARLANIDRLGLLKVHTKGAAIDGRTTLLSSINWNQNSITSNREAGVIIENQDVAEYFSKVFYWDWNEPPGIDKGGDIITDAGTPVLFNGDIAHDPDMDGLSYLWDFGDGGTSNEPNPEHTFSSSGLYTVTLTVTDGQYSDSEEIIVDVQKTADEPTNIIRFLGTVLIMTIIGETYLCAYLVSRLIKTRRR